MKNILQLKAIILMIILIFSQVSPLLAFADKNSVGTVSVKNSAVWVERNGKVLNIGSFGLKLKKDDVLKTNHGGKATIALKNGNSIYIAPSSEIQLTEEVIGEKNSSFSQIIKLIYGKIRAKIQSSKKRRIAVKTATATIGVKGTEFITEYKNDLTTVGTMEGLVNMESNKTKESIDIPAGKMASVSPVGEVLPLEEFAGELMEGVEFAGKPMETDEISGEKITF